MDIKILVATHKDYFMPHDDGLYLPIKVGNALSRLEGRFQGDDMREGGRDPFVQALAVSYLGMVLISLCNPGEFCPFPNAAMMVMLFAQAEEAVGDVAVPVRQLLVRHLGAPAGFLQF